LCNNFDPVEDPMQHAEPFLRKIHCNYYQKWMEEQAQSLIDKTTAAFQQGKIPPTPFSAPPPGVAMIPLPANIPVPLRPGMMPVGPAPGMKPPMGGHMAMMPGPPMMRPPSRLEMAHPDR
uniref:Uncharacterized protein n=1 Tax=Anolis carolinensis TaxID=28377 RepID=A0A803TUJ8_ANOCA